MPARIKKIRHDEETRAKIQAAQIINRLMDHINGKIDMTASQVSAALGLLRKRLPDLSAVDVSGEVAVRDAREITDDELAYIASGSSEGTATKANGSTLTH